MGLPTNDNRIIGLDVSDLILRAILFKGQGKNISIEAYNQLAIPSGLIKNGEIVEPRALTEIIKKLIAHPSYGRFTTKRIIASLPERKTFIKVIEIPPVDSQQLLETIKWETGQHIPLASDEMYLDWQIMKSDSANQTRVLIGAIAKNIADAYLAVLEDAALKPAGLVIESMAIALSVVPPNLEKNTTAIIVDLGLRRTTFLIYDRGVIRASVATNLISGQGMTLLLSQKLRLSEAQAEDAKRLCGLDPTKGRAAIPKLLLPYLEKMVREINKIINFYQIHYPEAPEINQIILVGGGANLRNIIQELTKRLNKKVVIGNPYSQFPQLQKNKIIPKNQSLSQPTVFGLGLMGISKDLIKYT